jgi:hypothetical protein
MFEHKYNQTNYAPSPGFIHSICIFHFTPNAPFKIRDKENSGWAVHAPPPPPFP